MFIFSDKKIIIIDNEKYIKRYLYGKNVLEKFDNQNKFVKYYIESKRPWSTLCSNGEAFIGDLIQFSDGYIVIINSIIPDESIKINGFYNVILSDIDDKSKKTMMPLDGKASWECKIERLSKN